MTSTPIPLDEDGIKIFAVGFDDRDSALNFLNQGINNGDFTENQVQFRDNIFQLVGQTPQLRTFYINLFEGEENVYFKDYVTNTSIVINQDLAAYPFGDAYTQTFLSLLNYISDPNPRYLIVYRLIIPATPSNFVISNVISTGFTGTIDDYVPTETTTGFIWQYSVDQENWIDAGTTDDLIYTFDYTGLNQGTTYYGRVLAVGEEYNSAPSNTDSEITTLEAPSDVIISNITEVGFDHSAQNTNVRSLLTSLGVTL